MRKNILIELILIFTMTIQTIPAIADVNNDNKIVMDFNSEETLPETSGGQWELKERPYVTYADYDFEKNAGDFSPVYGQWSIEKGKYIQRELSVGAAARNLLPDYYSDFEMEFDAVPLSEDTKLMVFFGCVSLYDVCVAEITKDGSKIIIGDNEYNGSGTIEKGKAYHVKFAAKQKEVSLFLNNELILHEENFEFNDGQIGIGCWNSQMEVDNFSVFAPDKLGKGKKLTQSSKEFSVAYMNNEKKYSSFSAQIAAENYIDGACGIAAISENNAYYFGLKNNKAYLSFVSGETKKVMAEKDFKAAANEYYDLKINIKDNKIICYINGEKLLSSETELNNFEKYAVFSDKTEFVCSKMILAENAYEYDENASVDFTKKTFTDIDNENLNEAVSVLNSLEIIGGYSDSTYRGEEKLTRGEFAEILFRMQNIKPAPLNKALEYSDVSDDYAFKSALYAAIENGYLAADGSEAKPYNSVSAEEAAKALLKILNADYMDKEGKTIAAAYSFGILKNVDMSDKDLTRYKTAQMVLNTLKAQRLMPSGINSNGAVIEKSNNMLSEIFNVSIINGTILADKYRNIKENEPSGLDDGKILLDDMVLDYDKDISNYLGCYLNCYVKEDKETGNDGELLWFKPYKTEITEISDSQSVFNDNNRIIEYNKYDNSDKATRIRLTDNTKVIYNGLYYSEISEAENDIFNLKNGNLKVVDNTLEKGIEYIFVNSFDTMVADSKSTANEIIYGKNSNEILNADEESKVIIKKNGNTIKIGDIKEYDVLSIQKPKSEKGYTFVTVSDKKPVMGIIKRKSEDFIIIENDKYQLGDKFNSEEFSASDYITAYLDFNSRVVYAVKRVSEDYGYLISVLFDNDSENLMLKMFTVENGKGKFNLAESVNVTFADSTRVKYKRNNAKSNSYSVFKTVAEDILDSSKIYSSDGKLKKFGVLIKYKLNNDGEIKEIAFSRDRTKEDIPEGKKDFSCYYDSEVSGENAYYYSGMINSKYRITNNTKVISLSGNCNDYENFKIVSASSLPWDEYYDSRIYDVSEEFEAKILVIQDINLGYDRAVGVISALSMQVDDKDNQCYKITMYQNGKEISVNAANDDLECDSSAAYWFKNEGTKIKDLKTGDIIIYDTDSEGYIKWFAVIFKNKEQEFYATSPRGWYWGTIPSTDMTVTYTPITKRTGNIFVFNSNNYSRPITSDKGTYYLYNKKKNTLTSASFDDIKAGDKAVLIFKSANLDTVVIYR
ncbi:MAG: S-layer homology domain-containing protein [Clostridia bacterium]|nr:S-layer homology domain-containing protein [Clostridia bacterium]